MGNLSQKSIDEFTVCLWLQLLEAGHYFEILYEAADDYGTIDIILTLGQEIKLKVFRKTRYDHSSFYHSQCCIDSTLMSVSYVYFSGFRFAIQQNCRCVGTRRAVASRVHNMEGWSVRSHEGWASGRTRGRTG